MKAASFAALVAPPSDVRDLTVRCRVLCCAEATRDGWGFVVPVKDEQGELLAIDAEILIAMILEMGTGSPNTPKGGLKELVEATGKGEVLEMPGKFVRSTVSYPAVHDYTGT